MSNLIEKGDMFYFYRNKVDVDKAKDIDDIQRGYLVLVPDEGKKARRLLVGKKRLPEIHKGRSKSTERDWMMVETVAAPEKIGEEMYPVEYETKTRGTRRESPAIPAAQGRYSIIERNDATQLAYKLNDPKKPGKAQRALGLQDEASYVISVKNPDVKVAGFPEERPEFPKKLSEKFGERRWVDVDDPSFLNHEKAQLVLIGAHESLEDVKDHISGKADVFKTLKIDKDRWPVESLFDGEFASTREELETKAPEGDRSKAGEKGGKQALKAPSAAGLAKSLKGVDFPKETRELADYAKDQGAEDEVVETLSRLPKRKYKDMSDVQKGLSEVR